MEPVNAYNFSWNQAYDVDSAQISLDVPRFMYRELPIVYNLTGMVLNAILLTYFIKSRKYRSPTFMLLTSLALMDIICCFAGASWSAFLFPTMPVPEVGCGCQILVFIGEIGIIGSEYHLILFAALRFYQLAFPLRAKANLTSGLVIKMCIIIVIGAALFTIPLVIGYGTQSAMMGNERITICTFSGGRRAYDVAHLIINTIIPCAAVILLHIAKYIVVWRSTSSLVSEQQNRQSADARAVTIIIILFFVAWFPVHVYSNIQHKQVENYKKMRDSTYLVLMYFIFSNSTMDPLVYCFAAKTVRDDVLKLICPRRQNDK